MHQTRYVFMMLTLISSKTSRSTSYYPDVTFKLKLISLLVASLACLFCTGCLIPLLDVLFTNVTLKIIQVARALQHCKF